MWSAVVGSVIQFSEASGDLKGREYWRGRREIRLQPGEIANDLGLHYSTVSRLVKETG